MSSTSTPKPKSGLEDLLPEILTIIFEQLPYWDLKRLPLVCKHFRSIVRKDNELSASQIDRTLFRDAPRLPAASDGDNTNKPTRCTIHPLLRDIYYKYTENLSDVVYYNPRRGALQHISDAAFGRENVCSPAASRAMIISVTRTGREEDPVIVEGTGPGGAVTVLDVMKAVVGAVKDKWDKFEIEGCGWDGLEGGQIQEGMVKLLDGYHEYPSPSIVRF